MTVKQISEVLKELGLSTKGPKIELQSRLLGAVERATVQCNTNTASIQASLVHASATATTAAVSYTTQLNQQEIPVLKLILLGDGGVGNPTLSAGSSNNLLRGVTTPPHYDPHPCSLH